MQKLYISQGTAVTLFRRGAHDITSTYVTFIQDFMYQKLLNYADYYELFKKIKCGRFKLFGTQFERCAPTSQMSASCLN